MALLFLMGGLFIIAFSIFQIVSSKQQTKESTNEEYRETKNTSTFGSGLTCPKCGATHNLIMESDLSRMFLSHDVQCFSLT